MPKYADWPALGRPQERRLSRIVDAISSVGETKVAPANLEAGAITNCGSDELPTRNPKNDFSLQQSCTIHFSGRRTFAT